jgi:hypothetical protein
LADGRGSNSPANAATSEQSEVLSMRCPSNEAPHKSPFNPPRNLEASVRSRDERHRTAGGGRDLIEAGLN